MNTYTHSQYVCPPGAAVGFGDGFLIDAWYAYHDPDARYELSYSNPPAPLSSDDSVVDAKQFPPRRQFINGRALCESAVLRCSYD